MSWTSILSDVARIAVPVLSDVLGQIGREQSDVSTATPYTLGDIKFYYDAKSDEIVAINLGAPTTLAYSKPEVGGVLSLFQPLAQFGSYPASSDLIQFGEEGGVVKIYATDIAGEMNVSWVKVALTIPVLAVSSFLFFSKSIKFERTQNGFTLSSDNRFQNAEIKFGSANGTNVSLSFTSASDSGLDVSTTTCVAPFPSGIDGALPLGDVDIELEVERSDFDRLMAPRKKLQTIMSKEEVQRLFKV